MEQIKAIGADRIYTGESWLKGYALLIKDETIVDVVPIENVPAAIELEIYKGLLVPAFIDLQIYGAYGHLLSEEPTIETLDAIYSYSKAGGANYCLPTVATNTNRVIYSCIDAVREYLNKGKPGVLGLHIEGPWISQEKRGAHIKELIHKPDVDEVKQLLEYGKGVIKMITLAPEVCSKEIVALIRSYGVVVSAGHSNATFSEATNAFNNGISAVTHLYNAMSGIHHREPGMVGAAFQHKSVMAGIIPDGYHVHYEAISLAKKIMGERLYIITDAVTNTQTGHYKHSLNGDKYVSGGILSGSALNMLKAVKNCMEFAGIELKEAIRMASLYPAKVLGLDNMLGKLNKGYRAAYLSLDDDLNLIN